MKTIQFTVEIKAPKEKVWYSLWDDENYETWTEAFCEGSHAVSGWEEGNKIHFLDPKGSGMASRIVEKKPYDSMVFTHITEIVNHEEQPISEAIQKWSGCKEQYKLTGENGTTTLNVEVESIEEYEDFFNNMFPNALQKIKAIAEDGKTKSIAVRVSLDSPVEKVWDYFTKPEHIVNWNFANDDWHCPKAENNLEVGKQFVSTMASKDGANSFDFSGTYTEIIPHKKIAYTMGDGRKVTVKFDVLDGKTILTEIFEPESTNSLDLQRGGWQCILDNFKKYTD
ncbi:SRPBCC domain-containing protein [Flavobacterium amniphilum]|uniref:SRPBCC domain-containing protein n=1 Tax=Flavobacterium amniphilum TaxID=1834035 RepID=UPI00293F0477|nr:SRPBCC domain-containing protein [Flavobacterium amniphilum]